MKLFIRVKDGLAVDHPIMGDNFVQAFPHIDINNLPPEFSEFVRIEINHLGVYEVYEGVTYDKIGNVFQDVHHVRPMTAEEKTARQNAVKEEWTRTGFAASWIFYENICQFAPPIPKPDDGKVYDWDEVTLSWIEVTV